jgi:hypothetical protein
MINTTQQNDTNHENKGKSIVTLGMTKSSLSVFSRMTLGITILSITTLSILAIDMKVECDTQHNQNKY